MKAALLVERPFLFPGRCAFCGRSNGPMIDTQLEDPGLGHVYVCTEVCLPAWAALIGLENVAELQARLDEQTGRNAELEQELGESRPIVDAVLDAVRRLDDGLADAPDLDVATPAICTETKRNGEPCTAPALPGHETCLAHTRVAA